MRRDQLHEGSSRIKSGIEYGDGIFFDDRMEIVVGHARYTITDEQWKSMPGSTLSEMVRAVYGEHIKLPLLRIIAPGKTQAELNELLLGWDQN